MDELDKRHRRHGDESERGLGIHMGKQHVAPSSPSPRVTTTSTITTPTTAATTTGLSSSYRTPRQKSAGSLRWSRSHGSIRSDEYFHHHHNDDDDDRRSPGLEIIPPLRLFSTPSIASSLNLASGCSSPLKRELSRSTLHDDDDDDYNDDRLEEPRAIPPSPSMTRLFLARRLGQMAQQVAEGGNFDELVLTTQADLLQKAMKLPSPPSRHKPFQTPQRPKSLDARHYSALSSSHSTPAPSLSRSTSRYSDFFSASPMNKARGAKAEPEPEPEPTTTQDYLAKPAMTIDEANHVIAEANKLNEELTTVVCNLRARQEESDHIQELLIERAERAAQRILFLQGRISHLEHELMENDDEVQHLRICLKAVEIQLPSRSRLDPELQHCIASFKQDYKDLRSKRAADRRLMMSGGGGPSHLDILSSPMG